jgi:hypothetical protein
VCVCAFVYRLQGRTRSCSFSVWFCRYALGVSNAYGTAMLCLFLVFITLVFQASSGYGLDATVERRTTLLLEGSNQTKAYYSSSQRLDWIQSTFGSSGWKIQV